MSDQNEEMTVEEKIWAGDPSERRAVLPKTRKAQLDSSQGGKAMGAGERLRSEIGLWFTGKGVVPTDARSSPNAPDAVYSATVVEGVPYENWYGGQSKAHFRLTIGSVSWRIQCHGQSVSGTATVEKIPGFIASAIKGKDNVILMLEGPAIGRGAKEWAVEAAKRASGSGKVVHVCFSAKEATDFLEQVFQVQAPPRA